DLEAVDLTIASLLPHLNENDIIDGGNSNYEDSERRMAELSAKNILFVGSGISGGELGALHGPSMMPGGAEKAWSQIKPIFEAITAKVGTQQDPCVTWVGNGGAGHFVKMVHNGIEYGDMQVICEGYDIAKRLLHLDNGTIANAFADWNNKRLQSYLMEISSEILTYKENGVSVVDLILDTAGQKGTGKWTAITALNEGIPLNLITESVFSRFISAQKDLRLELNQYYPQPKLDNSIGIKPDDIEGAMYASKLISYAQGFELMATKSNEKKWGINLAAIAKIWRGGCIIRSKFLDDIAYAYEKEQIETLLASDFYKQNLPNAIISLRKIVASASLNGIPVASMSAALAYYDAMRTDNLPANLLQAQRDYFGAHTYERIDKPRGEFFHTNWTGEGGDTISTTYNN
ncbi:MAG: decarboxylating NADP(+)-dependent phosphogluconate dehydrogenase, partial [Bacteroidales bacterium]|nr:decarboxylating NADP(+)-dependent phosphogluconate dehydrogenase [Bacteroidales bacterium]